MLTDRTIAITRSKSEAAEFLDIVKREGGIGMAIPTVEIVPKGDSAINEFVNLLLEKRHDYCAFMSAQAVRVLFSHADKQRIVSALSQTAVIAVGPKTSQELQEQGIRTDFMPEKYSSVGLVEFLSRSNPAGKKIIIPRSGAANEFAASGLARLGMVVDEVLLYTIKTANVTADWQDFFSLLSQKKIDAIIFTSASNVRSFFEIAANQGADIPLDSLTKVISIGPFTTVELDKRKIRCHEAKEHTVAGTLQTAREIFSRRQAS